MMSVILAAGESRRFISESGVHKLSVRIYGVPMLCYPVTSLSLAGIKEIVVVVNPVTEPLIRSSLIECPYISGFSPVRLNNNNEVWRDNGYSMLLGLEGMVHSSYFIVSMSDHIYPVDIPLKLMQAGRPCVGADSNPTYIKISEATKIHVKDRSLVVGKELDKYEYIDIGVHLLKTSPLPRECRLKYILKMSELLSCIYDEHFQILDFRGSPWADIDTLEDYTSITAGSLKPVVESVIRSWEALGVKVNIG